MSKLFINCPECGEENEFEVADPSTYEKFNFVDCSCGNVEFMCNEEGLFASFGK